LESLTRLRLHDDGLPIPDLQVWIGRDRVDMLFEKQRLILEVDGLEKYVDDALQLEKQRETRLRRLGYRVERVTADDVVRNWPETAAWLRNLLRLPVSGG
jgi:very-short-patch-repair endonuclease